MSQDSGVLPAFRSLAIFTAFAFAFYFLLVWNPLGTFGDIRTYLEHRVRVPIEWIVAVIPLAWLIHRNSGYTAAAAFLFPIFAVILALTTLNYGAAFWRIFRHEVYLAPVYAPRGLLVCFLLFSLVVFPRVLVEKTDGGRDKATTFALCLIIGFALTSWEALITPSPPRTFEGGSDQFVGQGAWGMIIQQIDQHVPPDYRNMVKIGVSLYPFLAFFLLLFPSYRTIPQDLIREHRESFPIYLFVGVLLSLSGWAFWSATRGLAPGTGTKFLLGVLSIPAVVALIVLVLSSIFWVPAGLFLLPAFLFWVLSQPFKVAYFLVVKVPFMVWHYLHYLSVPHPAETAYRAGVAKHLPIPELARTVADAMYRYDLKDFDGLPPAWKSKNYKKRVEAFNDLLKAQAGFLEARSAAWLEAEDRFMEELIKNLRMKSQLRE